MRIEDLQKQAEDIISMLCSQYAVKPMAIKVKHIRRGKTHWSTRSVVIPVWSYEQGGISYFWAYVIHEFTHAGFNIHYHGPDFREKEIEVLKQYGYVPSDYKKAYYRTLHNVQGEKLWYFEQNQKNKLDK